MIIIIVNVTLISFIRPAVMQNYASLVPRIIREPLKLAYYVIGEAQEQQLDFIVYFVVFNCGSKACYYIFLSRGSIDLPRIED